MFHNLSCGLKILIQGLNVLICGHTLLKTTAPYCSPLFFFMWTVSHLILCNTSSVVPVALYHIGQTSLRTPLHEQFHLTEREMGCLSPLCLCWHVCMVTWHSGAAMLKYKHAKRAVLLIAWKKHKLLNVWIVPLLSSVVACFSPICRSRDLLQFPLTAF